MDGYWSGGSEYVDSDLDTTDESESESVTFGIYGAIVERIKFMEVEEDKNNDCQESLEGIAQVDEMWLGLPDEIMVSILARLSFFSICSFRAVCKKWRALQWNALAINPDAARPMGPNSQEVPFCVVYTGPNQFASYNPSSHCWHQLPPSFVTSLEKSANNCNENRVVAASGGLLVLESPQKELYVVNPINTSSRALPPLLDPLNEPFHGLPPHLKDLDEISTHEVHLHLDEQHSSFMVFKYGKLIPREEYRGWGQHWIQIYNPKTDSWKYCGNCSFLEISRILSTVEFDGGICCLYTDSIGYCFTCVFQGENPTDVNAQVNVNAAPVISVRINYDYTKWDVPRPPRNLRGGQLFVKDENLMLGGVVTCNFRGDRYYTTRIWMLKYRHDSVWYEIAKMPVALIYELLYMAEPHMAEPHADQLFYILEEQHVFVHGDYMWVCPDVPPSVGTCCGVMCHMPSDSWWKLTKYDVTKSSHRSKSEEDESQQSSSSGEDSSQDHFWDSQQMNQRARRFFLFNPRMDLLV